MSHPPPKWRQVERTLLWILLAVLCTLGLVALRSTLDKAHMALLYLLLVLGASAREGRRTGIALAVLCFLAFNFFLLRPYYTFRIHDPFDWLVLGAFLLVGIVAAELLTRSRHLARQTERVEALREADRLKDELLASLSHDLRTPLTTIKVLANEMHGAGDPRAAFIEAEADRLNRLVSDLLDLSRMRAGGMPVNADIIAVDDLIGAALQRLGGHSEVGRIEARLDSEQMLVGRFDFVHSLRIVVNLLENALKFSPPDTPVELSARSDGERLRIMVADRGAGIAGPETERVFEAFYHTTADSPLNGAGLGLAIARDLARAQGGDVSYAPRPWGGSVFTLDLPAVQLDPEVYMES